MGWDLPCAHGSQQIKQLFLLSWRLLKLLAPSCCGIFPSTTSLPSSY